MFKITAALAASLCLAAPLGAQSFSPERIKADVDFLADDLLEGRNTGTRGYDLAALYVAKRFAALGLKPGNAGSWFQQVPFGMAGIKPEATNGLTIGGTMFRNGEDVVVGGSMAYPDQREEAEVVFVGYGLEDKRYGFDDYRGLDVRGKVVAFLSGTPEGAPSDITATLADERAKLIQSKGAIGTIAILSPSTLKEISWDKIRAYGSVPRLRWLDKDGLPYSETPKLRLSGTLGPKAAEALLRGTPLPLAKLDAMQADRKAMPRGFAIPGKVMFERHSKVERMTSPNVVGLIEGSDPKLANEVILLTAHLDHDGIVPAVNGDTIMNGAMDNAAGVATMLEAARAFTESGTRPKRSVAFVALTAEEDGLLGAEYLAKHPVLKGKTLAGVVNLDMPILTYDFKDVIAFGAEHSTMGPIVARAVAKAGVALSPDPMPEQGLFTRSDHYMFVVEGVPSVFLVTGWGGEGKAASQAFLANHYHQVSDSPALPFNWAAGAKFARINYLIARELADGAEAPRWYADSFFAKAYAKGRPLAQRP